jgi:NitT/TauT family transport system substrate-binding protein
VLNAIARGAPIRIVADKGYIRPGACDTNVVFVRRELVEHGPPMDAERIKGMVIGCHRDNIGEYWLDRLLARFDLGVEDVQRVFLPPAAYGEALEGGTVDAVAAVEPWVSRLRQAGHAELWAVDQEVAQGHQVAYVAFGPSLREDNPGLGRAFMVAYLKAVRRLQQGKTERNIDILARGTGLDRQVIAEACWTSFREDGRINVESVLEFQQWALEAGLMDAPVSREQLWDPSFVDHANAALAEAR